MKLTPEQLSAYADAEAKRAAYELIKPMQAETLEERALLAVAERKAFDAMYEAEQNWKSLTKETVTA